MTHRRLVLSLALTAFLVWEVYWAYAYLTRPIPDEKMSGLAAMVFGLIPGALAISIVAGYFAFRAMIKTWKRD